MRTTELKGHITWHGSDETTVQQQIEWAKHLRQEDALRPPEKSSLRIGKPKEKFVLSPSMVNLPTHVG